MSSLLTSKHISVLLASLGIFITAGILTVLFGNSFTGSSATNPPPITIGVLRTLDVHDAVYQSMQGELEHLGYKQGKQVQYIISDVGVNEEGTRPLVRSFISQDIDVIFALSSIAAKVAWEETTAANRTDIPIVFSHSLDSVEQGIVQSFESSGNNTTGLDVNFGDLTERKLGLLKQIDPAIQRLGYMQLAAEESFAYSLVLSKLEEAAPKFDLELVPFPLKSTTAEAATQEVQEIVDAIEPGEIDAFFHIPSTLLSTADNTTILANMTKRLRIPSCWNTPTDIERGGLFTYQFDLEAMGRESAYQLAQVLEGTHPSDIPLKSAEDLELFMNFDTIEEANLIIPDSVITLVNKRVRDSTIQ